MSHQANVTLDMSGMSCPAPLLGAKKIVDDLPQGQVLKLISDCPGTADDLFAWSRITGNVVLSSEKLRDGKTVYLVQRGGGSTSTPLAHVTLDMRGVSCPGPIVEARKLLDGMKAEEILQLVSDCPGSADDINAWARAGAAELVFAHETGRGIHEFFLKKK